MSSIPTPNYVLTTSYTYYTGSQDHRTLAPGTFVRPIELKYVPKHVVEDKRWSFNEEKDVYCYTYYGIIPIPRHYMRQV